MGKTPVQIAVRYTSFAMLSTLINIGVQMAVTWAYTGWLYVEVSILAGTAAGLPLRYFLEKRYIFRFSTKSLAHDKNLFIIYGAMGVITTLIFWSTEYAFHLLFDEESMRYVGGVIGLAIGFWVKYQLDKKYVFVNDPFGMRLWRPEQ